MSLSQDLIAPRIVEVPLQEDSCRRHAAEEQAPCAEPSVEENFHATRLAIWRARSAVGTRSPGSGNETSRREWHYFRIDEELFFWRELWRKMAPPSDLIFEFPS